MAFRSCLCFSKKYLLYLHVNHKHIARYPGLSRTINTALTNKPTSVCAKVVTTGLEKDVQDIIQHKSIENYKAFSRRLSSCSPQQIVDLFDCMIRQKVDYNTHLRQIMLDAGTYWPMNTVLSVIKICGSQYQQWRLDMFNTFILSNYTASKDIVPALQALPLQGKATDVMPFYNALLAKCQRSKQLEHMQRVLTVMKERHIQLDTASYNILMRAELSTPDATCAFDRFIQRGATPNRATYHILIKHAAQHKQWYALNQWLQLMADNGFEPNPVLVRILFKALVKHPLEKQLVQAFERTIQHVSIDEQLLNTGAAALLETKQTQAAIDILQLAIQKTPSSVYTWNLLLRGLCEQGNVKAALSLFGRIPQPDIVSYTTLIHGLVRTNNNIEDIAHLYRQLVNSSSTNHVLQSVIMYSLIKSDNMTNTLSMFKNVLLNKHNTTGLFEMNIYNMMIDFYFLHYHKSKRDQVPREALQLLTEAIDTKQLQPTVVTLNIMVRGLAILNKNLNAAEKMVNLLKQKGVDMNERTVWYLVKAAHRQGDHDRARQWIDTYEQHHIIQGNGLKLLKNKLMSWHSVQK